MHFNASASRVNWFNLIVGRYTQTIVQSLHVKEGLRDNFGTFNIFYIVSTIDNRNKEDRTLTSFGEETTRTSVANIV